MNDLIEYQAGGGGAAADNGFPTDVDARFARQQDFGYGSEIEPYVNRQSARVMGETKTQKSGKTIFTARSGAGQYLDQILGAFNDETKSRNIDLTKPENADIRERLANTFARSALAINKIPIATLGFDPRRVVMDVEIGKANIAGAYSPDTDAIYSNAASSSNLVHESIHRGLAQLRKVPELKAAFNKLPREEMVVRYLMATQAGDPERNAGQIAEQQREQALTIFKGADAPRIIRALTEITTYAQDEIKRRKPGGPR